jgi:hypothetical protein
MFEAIVMQVKAFVVLLLEALGISTVLAAFSLEFIMLHDILVFGNFRAIENNTLTLTVELSLAAHGTTYFMMTTAKRLANKCARKPMSVQQNRWRSVNKEMVSKVPLARIYCKKSRRDCFLSALVKSVGDNIHIDF